MTIQARGVGVALFLAPFFLLADQRQSSAADRFFCPITVFCKPKPPCIWYKCICPQRICPCCGLDNFGYYSNCWHAWPFPPDHAHCPVPPPTVAPPSLPTGATTSPEELPSPSTVPQKSSSQKNMEGRTNTCSCFRSVSR
jgi:hypothetical protein